VPPHAQNAVAGNEQEPRNRIFHATMAVALRLGFGKVTMDIVAREAGFSKGGLLYHFKTKNHLIAAMLEYYAGHQGDAGGCGSGIDPFMVALLIAASDNPALLEPYRERIGGVPTGGSLVTALMERFNRPEQASEPQVETQAFAVRRTEGKALLGLFVAQGHDALWDMVDEFSNPTEHEYRLAENGGLIVSEDAEMSGALSDIVAAAGAWIAFEAADVGSGAIARVIDGLQKSSEGASPEGGEERLRSPSRRDAD
jgi:AcrR family transcriptional regulator